MRSTSNTSRILSAALAALCSLGLLVLVSEQMNPVRLANTPQVIQWEAVVVTAPAPATVPIAAAAARTVAN